jgi:hypothetical protein
MPNTGIQAPKQGEVISASWLLRVVERLLNCIVGGRGISITRISGKIVISCTLPDVRGKGGGGQRIAGVAMWKVNTYNDLVYLSSAQDSQVEEGDLGYTYDQKVLYQYISGIGHGWAVISHHRAEVIPE